MHCHDLGKDGHLLVHRGWSLTGLLKTCFDDHHGFFKGFSVPRWSMLLVD